MSPEQIKVSETIDCNSSRVREKSLAFHSVHAANVYPPNRFFGVFFVLGTPVPGGECASKTLSFSSACKNLGRSTP